MKINKNLTSIILTSSLILPQTSLANEKKEPTLQQTANWLLEHTTERNLPFKNRNHLNYKTTLDLNPSTCELTVKKTYELEPSKNGDIKSFERVGTFNLYEVGIKTDFSFKESKYTGYSGIQFSSFGGEKRIVEKYTMFVNGEPKPSETKEVFRFNFDPENKEYKQRYEKALKHARNLCNEKGLEYTPDLF